jgi:hypothetical protein
MSILAKERIRKQTPIVNYPTKWRHDFLRPFEASEDIASLMDLKLGSVTPLEFGGIRLTPADGSFGILFSRQTHFNGVFSAEFSGWNSSTTNIILLARAKWPLDSNPSTLLFEYSTNTNKFSISEYPSLTSYYEEDLRVSISNVKITAKINNGILSAGFKWGNGYAGTKELSFSGCIDPAAHVNWGVACFGSTVDISRLSYKAV